MTASLRGLSRLHAARAVRHGHVHLHDRARLHAASRHGPGEAVARYRDYFRRAWEWSRPGAYFGLQSILRNRVPRQAADIRDIGWVTYEIFPGGITPRMEDIVAAVNPYWEIVEVRTRREDYRRTCEHWRSRLRGHEAADPGALGRSAVRRLRPVPDYLHQGVRDALPVHGAVVTAPDRRDVGAL